MGNGEKNLDVSFLFRLDRLSNDPQADGEKVFEALKNLLRMYPDRRYVEQPQISVAPDGLVVSARMWCSSNDDSQMVNKSLSELFCQEGFQSTSLK